MKRAKDFSEFKASHPRCCFCGGEAATETLDHVPSIQFFNRRDRPHGLEVPACHYCNHATGPSEQVVAALARGLRGWTPRGLDDAHFVRMLNDGLRKNAPDVLREWGTTSARQRRKFKRFQVKFGRESHPLNIGPLTHRHLQAFGAKLGCALHYCETGRPVPLEGGITVQVNTLGQRALGWQLPPDLANKLSGARRLKQGKKEVSDQFEFACAHGEGLSFYAAALGLDIALIIFVAETDGVFDTIKSIGAYVHKPGDFLSYIKPGFIGSISVHGDQPRLSAVNPFCPSP